MPSTQQEWAEYYDKGTRWTARKGLYWADAEGEPIEGLYVIGNCAGNFYGGVDYPLDIYGLSLGRCVSAGYMTGRALAQK